MHQPSYHQTDAHFTYTGPNGHSDATVYGSNLENVAVRVFDEYAGGHNGITLQPPRTIDNYVDHAVYSGGTKTKQTFEGEKVFESKMPLDPKLQFIFKQIIC